MLRFQVKCPICNQELTYNLLGKDYDKLACPHCQTPLSIQMRMILIVFQLIYFQLYIMFIHPYIATQVHVLFSLLVMVGFVVFLSVCTLRVLSTFVGNRVLFDVRVKKQ